MKKNIKLITAIHLIILLAAITGCSTVSAGKEDIFSFFVTADMRKFTGPEYQSSGYFMGTCEAIREIGRGSFIVAVGDIDPPQYVHNTVNKILGEDYPWYPVVGNHEAVTAEDMIWLRDWGRKKIENFRRKGPKNSEETTYSFDFDNTHFVVLNEYYDGISDTGSNGDITEPLYNWLKNELEASSKRFTFVFGHVPIVSIPDYHNGRQRHKGDNLDAHPENCHRFQQLLREQKVTAYICGHTHNFSYTKINGIWQLDAGHCRGVGDIGARSTFIKVLVGKSRCRVEVYRDDGNGGEYVLTNTIVLD